MVDKKLTSYWFIFILINSILAFSFQISFVSAQEELENSFFLGEYKANYNSFFGDEAGKGCCIEMNNGAICQNVPLDYQACSSQVFPTTCQNIGECGNLGCCIDETEGLCASRATKAMCEKYGGVFKTNAECNILECEKGCCVLGENTDWVTQLRCIKLSAESGFGFINFNSGTSFIQCLSLRKEQKIGACILNPETNLCRIGTQVECLQSNGDFYENYLCSNPELRTPCIKQNSVSCVQGKEEIYWFDSCGNRENIYSSDKEKSWNNGFILNKEESCNPNSANINSKDCGNCNYILGSTCMISPNSQTNIEIQEGGFICGNLNCIDNQGNERINGESWCEYEGFIGEGKDVVGSRHFRKICSNGVVLTGPCADYRQEVCAEKQIRDLDNNIDKSLAVCATNQWKSCLGINTLTSEDLGENSTQEVCLENTHCEWRGIKFGDVNLNYCLPSYPPGLRFWEEGERISSAEQCSIASHTCTVVFVRSSRWSSWRCEKNCYCLTESFTKEMNEFCNSLGDCGASINFKGGISDKGYSITRAPRLSARTLENLETYLEQNQNKVEFSNSISYGYSWERIAITRGRASGDYSFGDFSSSWGNFLPFIGHLVGAVTDVIFTALNFLSFGLFNKILGGRTRRRYVIFECLPFQAPTENQKCEECNNNLEKPCTEYRCKSLGSSCELININSQNPTCIETNVNDITPPKISVGNISEGYGFEIGENGAIIQTDSKECLREFTPVKFSILTDKYAICKYSTNRSESFSEMNAFFENNYYKKEHEKNLMIPSLSAINVYDIEGDIKEMFGKYDLYVRCQDTRGNINLKEFNLRFCITNALDITPAIPIYSNPGNGSFIGYNEKEKEVIIYFNEPAECRWDIDEDRTYFQMREEMECFVELDDYIEEGAGIGWPCKAVFKDLKNEVNNFYFRCLDQPWLENTENASQRNENMQSINYALIGSESELRAEITFPEKNQEIVIGTNYATLELKAKTFGGSENGKAYCSFNINNGLYRGGFFNTNSDSHIQKDWSLSEGDYFLQIDCQDSGNNFAYDSIEFSIKQDKEPPRIIRYYYENNKLILISDENAICSYSEENCNFNFEEGETISSGYTKKHITNWEIEKRYYIRCKDVFDNLENGCSIIIIPSI